MSAQPAATDQSAAFALLELTQGSVVTQAIYVAAKLGIADMLGEGPLSVEEIAKRAESDPEATHRLLQTLSGYSVFAERDDGWFELTPMASALRADAPTPMRDMALLMGHPLFWEDWGHLMESVQTGEASMPKVRGMGALEFLMANPDYAAAFLMAMANLSDPETDHIAGACDFSRFGKIVDVGGGRGALIAGILKRTSGSQGVLYDVSHNTGDAATVLKEAGVADRCTIEHGTYFESVPPGGDAYLLKHTLHDFDESQCLTVLKNIRSAIKPNGALFVIEYVLPGNNVRHMGNIIDLWLMLLLGAKERSAAQYSELLEGSGFKLSRVIPTALPVSIIEAVPV